MYAEQDFDGAEQAPAQPSAGDIADLMMSVLSDGLDHPELWPMIPDFVRDYPDLPNELYQRMSSSTKDLGYVSARLLLGMCGAAQGETAEMLDLLGDLSVEFSQFALAQGGLFHLQGLMDPENPKYQLAGKICPAPFQQLDVLERTSHLCCASWLNQSVGSLARNNWDEVWNSEVAQSIRASILDGSYRYCNKGACPKIQGEDLVPAEQLVGESDFWRDILTSGRTELAQGPEVVNLAYDRTCNLSCPSCRVAPFAADEVTRQHYEEMQNRAILPLLKNARTVFVTGSGDPFASKNFRRLMQQLTPEEYPELGFQIMTNGMLFTRRQWENFPTLHGRVRILKISIDAATGPTHELLRRGARWSTMLENMAFAGELTAQGLVDHFELVFTVQQENYREMADAVDLAHQVGATGIYFARLTNWGTFSHAQYRDKAIFLPGHAEYEAFVEQMQDPRLQDPIVLLGDLAGFVREKERVADHRAFEF